MNINTPHAELIEKARKGDKEAFEALFNIFSKRVINYVYRYTGDRELSEDVTLEAFLEVYKRLPLYREEGKFLPWVYRIAVNYAKKSYRKKRLKTVSMNQTFDDKQELSVEDTLRDRNTRPDDEAIHNETRKQVENCLNEMNDKYRKVLLLCDFDGLSYEEAAYVLKEKKMTIGTQLKRARKMFYGRLIKCGLIEKKECDHEH